MVDTEFPAFPYFLSQLPLVRINFLKSLFILSFLISLVFSMWLYEAVVYLLFLFQ